MTLSITDTNALSYALTLETISVFSSEPPKQELCYWFQSVTAALLDDEVEILF